MENKIITDAIEAAKKKVQEELEKKKAAEPPTPVETRKLYIVRNVVINSIVFVVHKVLFWLEVQATKGKIFFFVGLGKTRRFVFQRKNAVQMWIAGYRKIDPQDFLKEFPPKKGHKSCNYGTGWAVVQLPNKTKAIRFCSCVTNQYKASGKKYLINQPGV